MLSIPFSIYKYAHDMVLALFKTGIMNVYILLNKINNEYIFLERLVIGL